MSPEPVRHADTIIFPASLDPDAVSVVERLTQSGFESYLVGGCVRDLLCGMIPKDFDVSTAARPRQIRSRFRNCRVIGRRFKLAHVHFGDKIIEVATFRRTPEAERDDGPDDDESGDTSGSGPEAEAEAEDLLITRDNVYGTAEEDVLRRDFTINALLYDVGPAEVIDYVGGVKDLNDRVLRTIGDPDVRLAEDPIRMLRAIRFHSRLGLSFAPDLDAAMRAAAPLISKSAPPRILEEIYRVMTCGKARQALPALIEYGLMQHLLPGIHEYWSEHPDQLESYGAALDVIDHGTRRVSNAFLLALLFLEPWKDTYEEGQGDPMAEARDLITPLARHMSVPRRDVGIAKQLLMLHSRLERNRRSRRVRLGEFIARPLTQEAISLLYASCLAGRADPTVHAVWARRVAALVGEQAEAPAEPPKRPARKRKRRRRRGRSERDRSEGGGRESGRPGRGGPSSSEAEAKADDKAASQPRDRGGEGSASEPARSGEAAQASPGASQGSAPSVRSPRTRSDTRDATAGASAHQPGPKAREASRTPPKPKGLRGWIRTIFGGPGASQDASTPPSPPAAATRPSAPSGRPEGDGKPPGEPPRGEASTAAGEAAPEEKVGAAGGDESRKAGDDGGSGKSNSRRRRRRRSGRGSGRQRDGGNGGEAEGETAAASTDEDSKSRGRRGGKSDSGRGGRRRRGGGRDKGGSSASTGRDGGGRKKSSRKRSGSGKDRSKSDTEKKTSKGESKPAPAHERPEEIEDLFDW